MPGHLEKMYILAYSRDDYSEASKVGKFTAQVNPESYKISYRVEYCDAQAPGTSAVNLRFGKTPPQEFSFDFLFDSTGVIKDASLISLAIPNPFDSGSGNGDVTAQLESFKHTVLNYQGDIHRPYFLKLHWGTLSFKGVMTSMDIEFKLFDGSGVPIRAVAKTSFKGSIEDNLRKALEDRQSPDITHQRVFTAYDRFTLLTGSIYGSGQYYIDVAGFNGLNSFRKIPQGTRLNFPPLN